VNQPLTEPVRQALTARNLAHLVTLNADGSPQVTIVWVGLDGEEIVCAHLGSRQKLTNVRRDPRVVLSMETGGKISPERVSGVGPWAAGT
jgi:PPOX class probable F420-dependent enzyme